MGSGRKSVLLQVECMCLERNPCTSKPLISKKSFVVTNLAFYFQYARTVNTDGSKSSCQLATQLSVLSSEFLWLISLALC